MAYVVLANTAGIDNIPIPVASADGGYKIIDYRGKVLAQTTTGERMTAFAEIDLAALRRDRRRSGLNNLPSRQRFKLYSEKLRTVTFLPSQYHAEGRSRPQTLYRNATKNHCPFSRIEHHLTCK